eukprot:3936312-Rhodomonas_salina.1
MLPSAAPDTSGVTGTAAIGEMDIGEVEAASTDADAPPVAHPVATAAPPVAAPAPSPTNANGSSAAISARMSSGSWYPRSSRKVRRSFLTRPVPFSRQPSVASARLWIRWSDTRSSSCNSPYRPGVSQTDRPLSRSRMALAELAAPRSPTRSVRAAGGDGVRGWGGTRRGSLAPASPSSSLLDTVRRALELCVLLLRDSFRAGAVETPAVAATTAGALASVPADPAGRAARPDRAGVPACPSCPDSLLSAPRSGPPTDRVRPGAGGAGPWTTP